MKIHSVTAWGLATRPKTLIASISPVVLGTAFAQKNAQFCLVTFFFSLAFAVAIQVGTNLANDYFDFIKGADTKNRKGPTRVTQAKMLSAEAVRKGFLFAFFVAFLCSLYLIAIGGWIIAVLSILAICFGLLYTATPFAIGYMGLGELFVFFCFGPIATGGTYFLQTGQWDFLSMAIGIIPGSLSTAILVVNNLRDYREDALANKNTLVVRFGKNFGQLEYLFFLSLSLLFLLFFSLYNLILIPFCVRPLFTVYQYTEETELNIVLQQTAKILLFATVALCIFI